MKRWKPWLFVAIAVGGVALAQLPPLVVQTQYVFSSDLPLRGNPNQEPYTFPLLEGTTVNGLRYIIPISVDSNTDQYKIDLDRSGEAHVFLSRYRDIFYYTAVVAGLNLTAGQSDPLNTWVKLGKASSFNVVFENAPGVAAEYCHQQTRQHFVVARQFTYEVQDPPYTGDFVQWAGTINRGKQPGDPENKTYLTYTADCATPAFPVPVLTLDSSDRLHPNTARFNNAGQAFQTSGVTVASFKTLVGLREYFRALFTSGAQPWQRLGSGTLANRSSWATLYRDSGVLGRRLATITVAPSPPDVPLWVAPGESPTPRRNNYSVSVTVQQLR